MFVRRGPAAGRKRLIIQPWRQHAGGVAAIDVLADPDPRRVRVTRPAALVHHFGANQAGLIRADLPTFGNPSISGRTGRGSMPRPARAGIELPARPARLPPAVGFTPDAGPGHSHHQGSRPGCAANGPRRAGPVSVGTHVAAVITSKRVCLHPALQGGGWPVARGNAGITQPRSPGHLGQLLWSWRSAWRYGPAYH